MRPKSSESQTVEKVLLSTSSRLKRGNHSLIREFLKDQLPLIAGILILATAANYVQNTYFAGGDKEFLVAGVKVPIWHLIWAGVWTGYIMGLVGEASGIFSLPYSMSILQFTNVAVSPTSLITTFINPFGALLGFFRNKQWNLDLALWLCIGAIIGAPIGPFIRVFWLNNPLPFKAVIGVALFLMAMHLILQNTPWYLKRTASAKKFQKKFDDMRTAKIKNGELPSGLPDDFQINTVSRSLRTLTIEYWGETKEINVIFMVLTGLIVGIISATLGVGGGFMLVPILATVVKLPMYVLVAATIPFVIVLSIVGLLSYIITVPMLTGVIVMPDWSFGLYIACGATFGSWLASKTQMYISERVLKPMLGIMTGALGILYVINYFIELPFKL